VTYDAGTRTATLNPNADLPLGGTYTATVSASDVSGNAMSPVSWSFTVGACPCTLWDSSATPEIASQPDSAINLGLKFRSDVAGQITGIRFYKGAGNTGTHTAYLWTEGGALLASATFTGESGSGWQQVNFATPVAISANTTYVASYHAPNGGYSRTVGYFANPYGRYPLTAITGANGVYAYGGPGLFPTGSYQSTNYWIDVVFTP
jgi:hypothetical protein